MPYKHDYYQYTDLSLQCGIKQAKTSVVFECFFSTTCSYVSRNWTLIYPLTSMKVLLVIQNALAKMMNCTF